MKITSYLTFNGNCQEAFESYAQLLGGKIVTMMPLGDMAAKSPGGEQWRDRVMHAEMEVGKQLLMASDEPEGMWLTLHFDDLAEAERVFAGLAAGGTVAMPLQETFSGLRFGRVTDRFGIPWMLRCEPAAS